MINVMTLIKTLIKNHKFKKIVILVVLPLSMFGLIFLLSNLLFNLYKRPVNVDFAPVKIIEITEPFSGSLHFNDELGKDDFSNLIIKNIDNSQKTIELAMYSIDSVSIKDAILRASNRGVMVNLIFSNQHEVGELELFKDRNSNVKISFLGVSSDSYMHHKFLLIDRGERNQKLFFGSYNFTNIQGLFDPSFIFETNRPEIINVFGEEFVRLTTVDGWGVKKSKEYNPFAVLIKYPEGYLEIWFPPESSSNNIKERMLGLIKAANSNIKIMIWHLTDKDIASVLATKAKNTPVSIVTDDFNLEKADSVFPILSAQKKRQHLDSLEIVSDANRNAQIQKILKNTDLNSFLHQHLLIVDDQTVVFGTNNWSSSGFFANDESVMVSNIPSVVSAFTQSYSYNYNTNK